MIGEVNRFSCGVILIMSHQALKMLSLSSGYGGLLHLETPVLGGGD